MVNVNSSNHALARRQNRGLRADLLEFIIDFGHIEYGSGAAFHFIREDKLPRYLRGTTLAARARPWIVMTDPSDDEVVTVYAHGNAASHVRHKCRKARQWTKHLNHDYKADRQACPV